MAASAGLGMPPGTSLAAADAALLPRNLSPWGMFESADIVVKAVMIGLAFASLVTWTSWLAKTVEIRRKTALARQGIGLLERDTQLAEVEQASRDSNDAVAQIVQSASREAALSGGMFDDGFKERIALRLERVEAAMSRQIARGTGVLATIGATAPFVGLFGTVWGIMNAFIGISEAHTTNLAVVAPSRTPLSSDVRCRANLQDPGGRTSPDRCFLPIRRYLRLRGRRYLYRFSRGDPRTHRY
ncbi:tonB-system energizer ExbB [Bradyrhizobium sp. BR 1433]|uniref:tonB-system energizer ExbB n=1 Tax=Bradyrhizobium sp. BR 1433 TaxID=3447967 RepID=UPI003EE6F9E2